MKCQRKDYFDDMYPEFAPAPIEVACEEEATVRVFGTTYDDERTRIPEVVYACEAHAVDLTHDDPWWTFERTEVIEPTD